MKVRVSKKKSGELQISVEQRIGRVQQGFAWGRATTPEEVREVVPDLVADVRRQAVQKAVVQGGVGTREVTQ